MTDEKKPAFFFDNDSVPHITEMSVSTEGSNLFFDALKDAGIIQDFADEKEVGVKPDGNYDERKTQLVSLEFGVFKKDYSIHITPIHPKWNLDTQKKVDAAIMAAIRLVAAAVPPSFRIDVFQPRKDWELKVISLVIRDAASAWNFDVKEFEAEVIDKLLAEIDKVIRT
jgi:hypothetical protein